MTLFVQRHGTAIFALGYEFSQDGYASSDLTVMANHMFEGNPVQTWDYQQSPWSVLWCVLEDGKVAALTLQQEHQVRGWSLHGFSAPVNDVCCVPGQGQDDVYFSIFRDGGFQVERLNHRRASSGEGVFRDAGRYPVLSVLETLEWENQAQGTLQGRHRHIPVATLRLYETGALRAGIVTENSDYLDDVPLSGIYSGDIRMVVPGGNGRLCRLRLEASSDAPITVLGVFPEVIVDGD